MSIPTTDSLPGKLGQGAALVRPLVKWLHVSPSSRSPNSRCLWGDAAPIARVDREARRVHVGGRSAALVL